MIKVYGSPLCPDCIACKKSFDAENVEYEYHSITDDLKEMKAFLALRDGNAFFNKAREKGLIGIPVLLLEDGSLTFKWEDFVKNPIPAVRCEGNVCAVPK